MKMRLVLTLLFNICFFMSQAQESNKALPYFEIPDAPESYSQGAVVARMIDGLGFRYYWATEGLTPEDLAYKPSPEARTTEETIDHILGLSDVILNSALHKPNTGNDFTDLSFYEKRKLTLQTLKSAADIFRKSDNLDDFTVVFQRENGRSTFPFWNQINGPISDAIWHCGQVVSFRRASGNPYNSKASVFTGKLRK